MGTNRHLNFFRAMSAIGRAGQSADEDNSDVDVLVIGAGPTGLGAAKRLHQIVRCLTLLLPVRVPMADCSRTIRHG